jgi:hypothetical protein
MAFGQRVSTHRGTFGAGGWLWYLAFIFLLSGLVSLAKAGAAGDWGQALTGVTALGVGVIVLIVPVLRWQQSVDFFEHGFVWKRLYGVLQVAREDIRSATMITHHGRQGTRTELKVDLVSGKSLSIVGVEQPEQLVNLLRTPPPTGPHASFNAALAAHAPEGPQPGWGPGGWKPPGT